MAISECFLWKTPEPWFKLGQLELEASVLPPSPQLNFLLSHVAKESHSAAALIGSLWGPNDYTKPNLRFSNAISHLRSRSRRHDLWENGQRKKVILVWAVLTRVSLKECLSCKQMMSSDSKFFFLKKKKKLNEMNHWNRGGRFKIPKMTLF